MSASTGGRYLYRLLDDVGDGSGSADMNINGATTPTVFLIKPAASETFNLKRMNIAFIGASMDRGDRYGDLILANGLKVYIGNSEGVTLDYTLQQRIQAWPHWGILAGSDVPSSGGVGFDAMNVRWTFDKGTGEDVELVGAQGDYLAVLVEDDISALGYHFCAVQGTQ